MNPDTKHRAKSRLTTYSTLECAADPSIAWSAVAASHCERVQPSDVQPAAELGIRLAEEMEKGCISATLAAGYSSGPTGASLPFLYDHPSFQQPLQQESQHGDAACKTSLLPGHLQDQLAFIRCKYLQGLHDAQKHEHESCTAGSVSEAEAFRPIAVNLVQPNRVQQQTSPMSAASAAGVQGQTYSCQQHQQLPHSHSSPMLHTAALAMAQQTHPIVAVDCSITTTSFSASQRKRSHAEIARQRLLKQLVGEEPDTPDQDETCSTPFSRKRRIGQ